MSDSVVTCDQAHPLARGPRTTDQRELGVHRARALRFLSRDLSPEAQEDDHNLAEAAIRFVLSLDGVTTVLGGFSDARQVEEVAACSGKGPLSELNMVRLETAWRANFGVDATTE